MQEQIVGCRPSAFTANDGTHVSGSTIFSIAEIPAGKGVGKQTNKYFLSEAKIEKLGLNPEKLVGHSVSISYNRWGKLDEVTVID